MKKVGILLKSTKCNRYLYETVHELAKSDQIELFFLLNSDVGAKQGVWRKMKSKIKTVGPLRLAELFLFRIIVAAEFRILSLLSPKIREHNKILNIERFTKNNITRLSPVFSLSGLVVRYPTEDIDQIRSLELDLIVRGNAPGILKGDIHKSAKEGIISFHHGDSRWNRGSPSAFWEVYLRKPSTGFVIQILTEELGSGLVIFRGNIPTRRSYVANIVSLHNESNPYLARIILQYAASNHLPIPEEGTTFGGSLLKTPSLTESISYLLRTGLLYLALLINRLVLRKRERWGVAFVTGSWREAILRKGVQIKNPPNRFFADPFVITRNGRTVCFVEDYSYERRRGCITSIEIFDEGRYQILGPVIEETFHMSFPYLFEYEQELYMIPETCAARSIRFYKCVEFPSKWEFQGELLSGVDAVDSMIFENNGIWWLLTNMATEGNSDHCSLLMAYFSPHPLSGRWLAHELNPLIFDSRIGRNGGILDLEGNLPIRCRQKQGFDLYGAALTLARIVDLTPSSFREQEIGQLLPNFFHKIRGCHHVHSNGEYTVYDYLRNEALK